MKNPKHHNPYLELVKVMKAYGLRLQEVEPQDSLYKSSAVFRVKTNQGTVCIKPFTGSTVRLIQLVSYWKLLRSHHYPHMPRLLKTSSGNYWTRCNGRLYYVSQWIYGRPLGEKDRDYRKLGRALGKLHRHSSRWLRTGAPVTDFLPGLKQKHKQFRRRLAVIQGHHTETGRWFREEGAHCLSLTDEALQILDRREIRHLLHKENRSSGLVHGDVTCPNVLLDSSGIVLIDWDELNKKSTYYELAKTLCNMSNFEINRIKELLQGYQEARPLTSAERLLVSAIFRIPREAWYASSLANKSHSVSTFRILQITWKQRLAAIEWLDAWAKK